MNYAQRLVAFLLKEDEAVVALGGGKGTFSGTVGRGLLRGYWWAPALRFVIDALFGQGHCARIAAKEAASGA